MLSLSYRTPQGGTEAFYGIKIFDYVQKLSQFEVRNFGRISYKKCGKFEFSGISGKLELVCQSLLRPHVNK